MGSSTLMLSPRLFLPVSVPGFQQEIDGSVNQGKLGASHNSIKGQGTPTREGETPAPGMRDSRRPPPARPDGTSKQRGRLQNLRAIAGEEGCWGCAVTLGRRIQPVPIWALLPPMPPSASPTGHWRTRSPVMQSWPCGLRAEWRMIGRNRTSDVLIT